MNFEERLKYVFENNSIEITEFNGDKKPIIYNCTNCQTEYSYKCARNLFAKITLCKKCYNPYSRWNKERIQDRLDKIFPNSELEVLEFSGIRSGGTIKCLKCGTIEKINNFDALFSGRKNYFCNNCEKELDKIREHLNEELSFGFLSLLSWNGVNNKSKFKCNRCGHIFEKKVSMQFCGKICPNCFKVYNKFTFEEGQDLLNKKGNNEYQLLQYKGTNEKSLIKHNCGFIFSTRLSDFQKTRGCPKCYKKISKYERQFKEWLEKNNIDYVYQKRFSDLPRQAFDFEIYTEGTSYLIEIQGEQHYRPVEVFDDFEIQKQRDLKKKEYCLINNINLVEIPYWEFKDLDSYLQNKFNDYLKGVASSGSEGII